MSRWRSSSWTTQKQPPARIAVSALSFIAFVFLEVPLKTKSPSRPRLLESPLGERAFGTSAAA
jgi:hypothetical protein